MPTKLFDLMFLLGFYNYASIVFAGKPLGENLVA